MTFTRFIHSLSQACSDHAMDGIRGRIELISNAKPEILMITRRLFQLLIVGTTAASWLNAEPPQNKAEELFRQMEKQCVEAKTIEVAFDGEFAGTFAGNLSGGWTYAIGNRFRLEVDGKLAVGPNGQQPIKLLMVSDGKKATTASLGPNTPVQILDASQTLDAEARLMLARAGVLGPMFLLAESVRPGQKPPEFNADEQLRVCDFRMGENNRLQEQNALIIHHKLHNRIHKSPLEVTVWLDAETKLPTKRILNVAEDNRTITLTETFTSLTLNEKVDDQRFQLPKK